METFLLKMEKADLTGKIGAAFGYYGWSGESVQMMSDTMKYIFGMEVTKAGFKLVVRSSGSSLERYKEFGREIVERINEHKK
jgi:flavorubredoxin